jgi:site-specific DNA-methyltransferase (adenine-specific)
MPEPCRRAGDGAKNETMEITGYKAKHEWEGSTVYLMDCMEALPQYPAGWFDLACVDPPYGINHSEIAGKQSGTKYGRAATAKKKYTIKDWDKQIPPPEYFEMLVRASEDQIIWGANYMTPYLPPSMGWVFWDKDNGSNGFSDGELAFTSFDKGLRKVKITWSGMLQQNMKEKEERIHPTQKPVALYSWIYHNYLPQGGKVLDTHLGSASNRIAAHKAGNIEFTGFEIDEEYFYAGVKRFEEYARQLKLF